MVIHTESVFKVRDASKEVNLGWIREIERTEGPDRLVKT